MPRIAELRQQIERSRKLAQTSKASYLAAVDRFGEFLRGRDASVDSLTDWRTQMEQAGLKAQTINARLSAVRRASSALAKANGSHDFAQAVEKLPVDDVREPTVLTAAQCRTLLGSCEASLVGLRDRVALELGLRTGMRRAELCALDWSQLTPDGRKYARITYKRKGGKTGVIRIGKPLVWLRAWGRAAGTDGRILRSVARPRLGGRAAIRASLTTNGLYKALRARAAAVGLELHPHAMRHTFVTLAREAGVPDWRINAVTGHVASSGGFAGTKIGMIDNYTHDLRGVPVGDLLPF